MGYFQARLLRYLFGRTPGQTRHEQLQRIASTLFRLWVGLLLFCAVFYIVKLLQHL